LDRDPGGSDDGRLAIMMKMRRASLPKIGVRIGRRLPLVPGFSLREPRDDGVAGAHESIFSAWMKASCGISTLPNWRM
jgi:hypothetical protein